MLGNWFRHLGKLHDGTIPWCTFPSAHDNPPNLTRHSWSGHRQVVRTHRHHEGPKPNGINISRLFCSTGLPCAAAIRFGFSRPRLRGTGDSTEWCPCGHTALTQCVLPTRLRCRSTQPNTARHHSPSSRLQDRNAKLCPDS